MKFGKNTITVGNFNFFLFFGSDNVSIFKAFLLQINTLVLDHCNYVRFFVPVHIYHPVTGQCQTL